MSLVSIQERFFDRTAKKTQDKTTATRSFIAVTDNVADDALTVISDGISEGTLPDVYETHPTDDSLWVESLDPKLEGDDGMIWLITVSYVPTEGDSVGGGEAGDPWEQVPIISLGFQSRQKVFERAYAYNQDIDPNNVTRDEPKIMVTNRGCKTQLPFDPPAMLDDSILVINIQRNTKSDDFDPTVPQVYNNTINSVAITVGGIPLPKFTGWIRDWKVSPTSINRDGETIKYAQETIEVLYDPQTWIKKIANVSTFKAGVAGGGGGGGGTSTDLELAKLLDDDGDPVREPVRIDLNGVPLADGDDTVYLPYHGLWEIDWEPVGLPDEFFPTVTSESTPEEE